MRTDKRPYVPGFEADIFISYAHIDNADDLCWVSELHRFLDWRLQQLLGTRAPALDASRRSNARYEELAQTLAKLLRDLRETMSVRAQSPLPPDGTPAPSEVKSSHPINLSGRPSRVALKGCDRWRPRRS